MKRQITGFLYNIFKIALLAAGILAQLSVPVGLIAIFWGFTCGAIPLTASYIFGVILVVHIVNSEENHSYISAWLTLFTLLPFLFGCLYLTAGKRTLSIRHKRIFDGIYSRTQPLLNSANGVAASHSFNAPPRGTDIDGAQPSSLDAEASGAQLSSAAVFIERASGYPVYAHEKSRVYYNGGEFFNDLLHCIMAARRYVYLDIFMLDGGNFSRCLIEMLVKRAADGVDVRLICDATGSSDLFKSRNYKLIKNSKILFKRFNPALTSLNATLRNHRKLAVIDGRIAFTGGANITDENFNSHCPYGCWRDNEVRIDGCAAYSFYVMFLRVWTFLDGEPTVPHLPFSCPPYNAADTDDAAGGFVQPFSDGPHTRHGASKGMFITLLEHAVRYAYLSTPYLLPDDEVLGAITRAARRGVNVVILTPHIPDKKLVFKLTRSFYCQLIGAGAHIYEFSSGFNHAKTILIDDSVAYIGSCNIDYRSFYMQCECGIVFYRTPAVADLKSDFMETLKTCREVTPAAALSYKTPLSILSPLF